MLTTWQQQIDDLQSDLAGYTHEYLAPRGQGHNRVPERTGPAEFQQPE